MALPKNNENGVPSFSEWFERYERQQTIHSDQIGSLSQSVASLTADVKALLKNQEALFSKTSKPFQWSAFVAAISLAIVSMMLVITPMKEQDARHEDFDKVVLEHMMDSQFINGQRSSDREWMMKLEERTFTRLYELLKQKEIEADKFQ